METSRGIKMATKNQVPEQNLQQARRGCNWNQSDGTVRCAIALVIFPFCSCFQEPLIKFTFTILLLLVQLLKNTTGSYDTQLQLNLDHRMALWVHTRDEVTHSPWEKSSLSLGRLLETLITTQPKNLTVSPAPSYPWEAFTNN